MKQAELSAAPEIIRDFLGYLQVVKGKSPNTVWEYYLDLRTFFRYLKQKRGLTPSDIPFSEIDIQDIDLDFIRKVTLTEVYEYMNFLTEVRGNKAAARSRYSDIYAYMCYGLAKEHLNNAPKKMFRCSFTI